MYCTQAGESFNRDQIINNSFLLFTLNFKIFSFYIPVSVQSQKFILELNKAYSVYYGHKIYH